MHVSNCKLNYWLQSLVRGQFCRHHMTKNMYGTSSGERDATDCRQSDERDGCCVFARNPRQSIGARNSFIHQEKLSEKSWHRRPAQLRPPSLSSAMLYICIGGGGGRCILKKGKKGKLMLSRFSSWPICGFSTLFLVLTKQP